MTGRVARAALLAASALSGVAACSGPDRGRERDEASADGPPNVVFVLADDLGWGELGSYGQARIRTPALDRMAREGLRFTDHYSGSPVCAPSRDVLLTGLHTGHAYIRDNDELPERGDVWGDTLLEGQRPIRPGTYTLGRLFEDAGYVTAAIGKWGLGGPGSGGEPNLQGFDRWLGYLCQREAHNYYPTHLWRDGEKLPLPGNPWFSAHQRLPEDADPDDPASYARYSGATYSVDVMMDEAEAFLRAHRDEPFFLYLPLPLPHLALQVPEEEVAAYRGAFPEEPYTGDRGYLPHREPRAAYAAMISRLDRGVGRLLALLAELDLDDRTLVVFTSDNGPSWVGGVDPAFFASAGGLRGRKAQLREGGIRVPLLARWPGRVPADAVSGHAAGFADWMATFAELLGRPSPPGDGVSLLPTLLGEPGRQAPSGALYWEFQGAQAIRFGSWKAIRPGPDVPLQLYDLAADPGETVDLAPLRPGVVEEAERRLAGSRTESELFPLRAPGRD